MRPNSRRSLGSLGTLLALTIASAARGEEVKPYPECTHKASETDMQAAQSAHKAAEISFNEADYPRAILYWEDAFRRDCSANLLLFNLSRAYEANGQKGQAVVALETLVQREPNLPNKAQYTRRIEALKEQIAAESAPPPETSPAVDTPPPAQPPPPTDALPTPARTPSRPVLPLVVAGVGGALFLVGGVVWLGGAADVNRYEQNCPDRDENGNPTGCPPDEVEPANQAVKRRDAGGAVTLIGLPIMVGGLIWYFATPPKAQARRTLVTPAVGRNFVGLELDGTF